MKITTEGGTTFVVVDGNITISHPDQQFSITIPEDDMEEFWEEYADRLSGKDDLE